jgi:hypothetical protein
MDFTFSERFAAKCTLFFWTVVILIGFFLQFLPNKIEKEKFTTLSLRIATQVEPSTVKEPEKAEIKQSAAVPKAEPLLPVKTESVSTPKTTSDSVPKKNTTTSTKKTETSTPSSPILQKSMEQLMAEAAAAKPKKEVNWDDSLFEEDVSVVQSSSESKTITNTAVSGTSALSGSAAVNTKDSAPLSGESTGKYSSASSNEVSQSTSATLQKISQAVFSNSGSGIGITSTVEVSSTSGTNGVSIALEDGSVRKLLDPAKPVLFLSEEAESLIDSTKQVRIVILILANGNVPLSSITFEPAAVLPVLVQSEIRSQIASWRFEAASSNGQAGFNYSINKR